MKARLNKVDANAMYMWSCLQIHFQYLQIHLKFLTNTFVNVLQIQLKFLTNAFEKEISGEVEKGWQRWQIHLKMFSARQQLNICPASRAHMCQTLCLKKPEIQQRIKFRKRKKYKNDKTVAFDKSFFKQRNLEIRSGTHLS